MKFRVLMTRIPICMACADQDDKGSVNFGTEPIVSRARPSRIVNIYTSECIRSRVESTRFSVVPGPSGRYRRTMSETIVIRGGRVVDARNRRADAADILIDGDTIPAIGPPGLHAPEDARIVPGA